MWGEKALDKESRVIPLSISAYIKISITLWIHCIKDMEHINWYSEKDLSKLTEKVHENTKKLNLPQKILNQMLPFFDCVKYQIYTYKKNMDVEKTIQSCLEFVWTKWGTINRISSPKKIIQNKEANIMRKYGLACTFCLENEIQQLWKEFDYTKKLLILSQFPNNFQSIWGYIVSIYNNDLVLRNKIHHGLLKRYDLHIVYERALIFSLKTCNESGLRLFLKKLDLHKRDNIILRTVRQCFHDNDILGFLFFELEENKFLELLKSISDDHVIKLYSVLLKWPWQYFFLPHLKEQYLAYLYNAKIVCFFFKNHEALFRELCQNVSIKNHINNLLAVDQPEIFHTL